MASAWGDSWGSAWGSSWGGDAVVVVGKRFCLSAFNGERTNLSAMMGERFNLDAFNIIPAALIGMTGERMSLAAFDAETWDLTATNEDCEDDCG